MNTKLIRIEDFTYELPDEHIAKYPLEKRENSKLLIYRKGQISETIFYNLPEYISAESLLVFNNTKVIQARLEFRKQTGARIEIFCLEPYFPTDYVLAFQQKKKCQWRCIIGNLKKWHDEILLKNLDSGKNIELLARRIDNFGTSQIVEFEWNTEHTFGEILEVAGQTPIPPYLNRQADSSDTVRYQTVYSAHKGSVAAPTAGLHFTNQILDKLTKNNVKQAYVTLHVGAGTFQPVKTKTIGDHPMHTEHFTIELSYLEEIISKLGKIIAVGTTTVRTLESLYWLGVKVLENKDLNLGTTQLLQWEAYNLPNTYSVKESLSALLEYLKKNCIKWFATQIIIAPGYQYKVVNQIITNFHQPQSTLLLLVGAYIGEDWKKVYKYALENNFRFLSYGDSSFLTCE